MDNPNKSIEDLLSGQLDGVLSEGQSIELSDAMAQDPSISGLLNELGAAKRSLVSGRSTQSLGIDFAASVVMAAQKRGMEMGEMAPAWLISNEKESGSSSVLTASTPKHSRRWLSAGMFSLAATLVLIWLTFPSAKQDEIAKVPKVGDSKVEKVELADRQESSSADSPTLHSELQRDDNSSQRTDSLADTQKLGTSSVAQAADLNGPVLEDPIKLDSKAGSLLSGKSPQSVEKVDSAVVKVESANSEPKRKLFYTMVLDVSIDPKAIENRTLERILEKYNIVYTDELVLDDSQLKSLEESKLIGSGGSSEEKMGVMFLRSTAKKLDLAIREIINQFEDFPDFALDITTDSSAQLLVKQLGAIKVAEGSDGFANRLVVGKNGQSSSPFSASTRRGRPMPTESRTSYKGGMISASSKNDEMSNVLILLRPASK